MATPRQISSWPPAVALSDTDVLIGDVSAATNKIALSLLRTQLNIIPTGETLGIAAGPLLTFTAAGSVLGVAAADVNFTGNLALLTGKTLGIAAGPLLTFNGAGNILGITGASLGVGTPSPITLLSASLLSGSGVQLVAALASGTTNTIGNASTISFHGGLASAVRGASITGINTSGASNAHDLYISTGAAAAAPTEKFRVTSAGAIKGLVWAGGVVNAAIDANGNLIRDPSDAKFKDDCKQITNPMELVRKLIGKSGYWKPDSMMGSRKNINPKTGNESIEILSDTERKAYFFVHQDVVKTLPEMATAGEYGNVHNEYAAAIHNEALKHLEDRIIKLEVA